MQPMQIMVINKRPIVCNMTVPITHLYFDDDIEIKLGLSFFYNCIHIGLCRSTPTYITLTIYMYV